MISFNVNTSSLIAQRSLTNSTKLLNQAIERMSTGFKINHASDNAANYSISTNLATKLSAYQIAEDNVAQGIDYASTATENIDLMYNLASRLRGLAEQANNGTYDANSIQSITKECTSIINEMYRIKNSTTYNNKNIFGENAIDSGVIGLSKNLIPNENGFLYDIEEINTDGYISMSDVDELATLAQGNYTISNGSELAKFSKMVNNALVAAGSTFVLTNDIDLADYQDGEGWYSIGGSTGGFTNPFTGIFDGNGHTIKNLYINTNSACRGLFGYVKDAVIKNVGIESGNITGGMHTGGLVGIIGFDGTTSTIYNCFSKANVHTTNCTVGGVAGYACATVNIEGCYSTANLSGNCWFMGGIVSGNEGTLNLKDTFFVGNIINGGDNSTNIFTGGLVGCFRGNSSIENSFVTGSISCTSNQNSNCGGLVGGSQGGSIKNCYFSGTISNNNGYTGGIIGECSASVKNSYFEGSISTNTSRGCGGIVGYHYMGNIIIDSNAVLGEMNASTKCGIFVGEARATTKTTNSFYDSKILAGIPFVGNSVQFDEKEIKDIRSSSNIQIQAEIHANNISAINIDTYFTLGNFNNILINGIDSPETIDKIDTLLSKLNDLQISLGAASNRLESAFEEISTNYENILSSHSTLRDSDISNVSSEYIRQQILQQASATLLSTANQSSALALQLL